ncbi:MAG: DUF72 domain-containing protein [Nitrospiraceae bacterium]|nr:DUF72 domain-containing protein [Nitrospiraceae bacterium]
MLIVIYYCMPYVKIGCCGFINDDWKGTFYPEKLSKKQWLEYYCKKFQTLELDTTFHKLPEKETFSRWHSETPGNFSVSLKGSRFITHVKKLKSPLEPLDVFFSRVTALKDKLGVVLWQFPPDFKADTNKLAIFIQALGEYKVKNAVEFRDKSWLTKKIFSLLEKNNVALCISDWPDFLCELPATADFVYIRRHGIDGKCSSCYTTDQLKKDARMINRFVKNGRDVMIYFNNITNGNAPNNARELSSFIK